VERRLATIGSAAIVGAAVLLASAAVAARGPAGVVAAVELRPDGESSVRGTAFFSQRGRRLSGWVVVWGLAPGTSHAVHFHGPRGSCASRPAKLPRAGHRDLTADSRGVAFLKFAVPANMLVLRRGFYYNVHAGPSSVGSTPSITCGEIRPLQLQR
jgi:hypothetical protein